MSFTVGQSVAVEYGVYRLPGTVSRVGQYGVDVTFGDVPCLAHRTCSFNVDDVRPLVSLVRRCGMAHMWGAECQGAASRVVFGRYDGPLFPELGRDVVAKSLCDFHIDDMVAITDAHWVSGRAGFQVAQRDYASMTDEPIMAEL